MNSGNYTRLEIFARAMQEGGSVRLISSAGESVKEPAGKTYYRWIRISVEKNTDYEIICEDCYVSLCYLSGCEHILDTGVCYLEMKDGRFENVRRHTGTNHQSERHIIFHRGKTGSTIPTVCAGSRDITICFTSLTPTGRSGPTCTGDMQRARI